jgi:hypothetical protein
MILLRRRFSMLRRILPNAFRPSSAADEQLIAELASRHPAGVLSPVNPIAEARPVFKELHLRVMRSF